MGVYVDPIFSHWRNKRWCHLFADSDFELHQFARELGLKRQWFQEPPKASWRHYDITEPKRKLALKLGAIPMALTYTPYFAAVQQGRDEWAKECWERFLRKHVDR